MQGNELQEQQTILFSMTNDNKRKRSIFRNNSVASDHGPPTKKRVVQDGDDGSINKEKKTQALDNKHLLARTVSAAGEAVMQQLPCFSQIVAPI